ncbi:20362_t:CDS:2, partial [Racocetra persica]
TNAGCHASHSYPNKKGVYGRCSSRRTSKPDTQKCQEESWMQYFFVILIVITNDQDAASTKDILWSTACSKLSVNTQIQAQSIISSKIRDESKGSLFIQFPIKGQSDKEKDNNPDHLPELEHNPTRPESLAESKTPKSSSQDTISDDSVEILKFVETIYKENISNEIRKRNRKKKLQNQGSMQSTSSSSDIQNNGLNP